MIKEALEYHEKGRKGKIEVIATKPCRTQKDLSLAYTPGVAEPCREIVKDPDSSYRFTAKGNLVGSSPMAQQSLGWVTSVPWLENL